MKRLRQVPARCVGHLDCLVLLLFMLLVAPARADLVPVPELRARVTDLTGILSAAEQQALEDKLAAFEQQKGAQLAILIVPTTRPETIEQFGIRVVEAWKLGRKGVDDGLLLLVAKDDRALRIEVGYGLEGVIPDAVGKRVIEEVIVPRLRAGEFAAGLDAGIGRLTALISGEPLPPPDAGRQGPSGRLVEDILPVAMLFVFLGGGLLRALFGRLTGASIAAAIAFVGGWILMGSLIAALFAALMIFFVILAGGSGGGRLRSGGSGGGGGFGGGGFGGGGGGFGGGGASGRW